MILLRSVGWTLAHLPEFLLRLLAVVLGEVVGWLPRRRRTIRSNLHHAFPERPPAWHNRIVRESGRRLIETGLWSLASPYLSDERLCTSLTLSPAAVAELRSLADAPRPLVVLTPHLAYWEALTCIGLLSPAPLGEFGVIFRPLRNPDMDAFVQRTRERFGMRLLSRKSGFQDALRILRDNGRVALLFDQNARDKGALTFFLDRLCSTTELAGLLRAKYGADAGFIFARRVGFWRVVIEYEPMDAAATVEATTLGHNRWLENKLRTDDNLAASWLWSHNRWRTQDEPRRRFRLEQKRDLLAYERMDRPASTLPRRTRFYLRLPDAPQELAPLWPVLRDLREARPDVALTLVGPAALAALVRAAGLADQWLAMPSGWWPACRWSYGLRRHYVDTWVDFARTPRSRLEAWLSATPQRFGIHHQTGCFTHVWQPHRASPPGTEAYWREFMENFGLPTRPILPSAAVTDAGTARI
jgi:lauroyl/myristoyl acyltransferase